MSSLPLTTAQWIGLMIPLTFFAMVLIEQLLELLGLNHAWPQRKGWQFIGLFFFSVQGLVNGLFAGKIASLMEGKSLLSAQINYEGLGVIPSAMLCYVVFSLVNALIHRSYHASPLLWRYVHRMHHAPRRSDVAAVMYQSPLEIFVSMASFVIVSAWIFGLPPAHSMACAWIASFYGFFQHFNIRTPQWLGYIIQRPESHCLHHARGVHDFNYSDLPIWDILLRSFRNPERFEGKLGFPKSVSERDWRLLMGLDGANKPAYVTNRSRDSRIKVIEHD